MMWQLGLTHLAAQLDRDLQAVARRVGGPRRLWDADRSEMIRAARGDRTIADALQRERRSASTGELDAQVAAAGAWVVGLGDDRYPHRLGEIVDPPFALLGLGHPLDQLIEQRPTIAVVGSRHPTARGREFARQLSRELSEAGAAIVSGLALGIDAAAHEGAHDAGGTTVAVLGCGVDVVHPQRHRALRERIRAGAGAVVSEYWLGVRPMPWRFPARNRIVAALADAVIVVEAAARSGALITADFALEGGTPVLAVPGPARAPMSAGCHALLRAGAGLCEGVDDVLAEVPHSGWRERREEVAIDLDGTDALVYRALLANEYSIDELVDATGTPVAQVIAAIGRLEFAGHVHCPAGVRYLARASRGAL